MNRFTSAFCLALTLAATPLATAADDRLTVRGKDLLFNGKPIRLRGVSVGDPVRDRQGRPVSDYKTIANDWKANVVRIGIYPHTWKTGPQDDVLDQLAKEVDAALKTGLFVIINYMVIGWPDGHYEVPLHGGPEDLVSSNFKLATTFWDKVAARWGKDGRVMFELWNEAIFQHEDWRPEVGQKWSKLKPYHAKLLEVVRKHGDNVAIVSSNHWSYMLTGVRKDLLEGKNIAYSWHIYGGQYKNDTKRWTEALDDLQTVAPVIAAEWGFEEDSDRHYSATPENFGKPFVRDFLEAKELHSVAWCWHPKLGPPMLKDDWKTPTKYGTFVRDYLQLHAK